MLEIALGVIFFTVIVIALVFLIIGAKSKLVAAGDVEVLINHEKKIHVPVGSKLLTALVRKSVVCLLRVRRRRYLRTVQGQSA